MSTDADVNYVAAMKALKDALGDNDLAKQVFADANALDRQTRRDHFDSRLEYIKQVAQLSADAQKSTQEQGLQTLKWLFLLNAGAVALVLTFAGSKAPEVKALLTGALIKPVGFFVLGCVFVVGAGAAGFFNFFRAMGSLPSASALHQFVDPTNKSWPLARGRLEGESPEDFGLRYLSKIDRTFSSRGRLRGIFRHSVFGRGYLVSLDCDARSMNRRLPLLVWMHPPVRRDLSRLVNLIMCTGGESRPFRHDQQFGEDEIISLVISCRSSY